LLLDSRDNRVYKTILIGNQCWMAENLNIGVRIDGANNQADNSTFEKYCYDNDPANCETYGGLYQWDEAMQYVTDETAQGICPDGWHMPTDWQWQILEGTADSQYPVIDPEWDNLGWRGFDAGGNLKETGTTHWNSPNTGATNFSGFTALPGGRRDPSGDFNVIGDYSYWWSASQSGSNRWSRRLHFINVQINRNEHSKSYGFSIRCLKDSLESNHSPNIPSNPYPADGSVDISIDTLLHWSASDPDPGDVLLYNIYFGLENNPPLAATKQFDTVYNPGAMYNDSVYYWKVVAVDIYGDSAVSPVWSFTTRSFACGDALADARDGQSYNTVLIGNQCWMAENMNIGSYKPGSYELTDNGYIERYCYGDNPANCDTYGGLYQWEEAMHYVPLPGAKGICPQGWHIPTDYEWKVLEGTVDTQFPVGDPEWDNTGWRGFDAGGNLKETGTSHWSSPNTGATNSSGFTALPAGYRDISASFGEVSITTTWWSSVLLDDDNGWRRRVRYNNQQITRNTSDNGYGFSVRCLKNPANQPPTMPSSPTPENGATNITIDTVLTWVATDPDFDPMYFSIYLGTTPNPPLITEKHLTAIYNPGVLYNDSTYYWKIVAFDIHGDSAVGPVWSFTTSPFACGDPLPVNHTAGDVAPVSKTVNYGTVETNLTGTNQCWITQNLGSDQQATSSTDATEASAGWYWQFNCKQGYKHDGTTRTPNTTWITSIDENSDWQTANDPCTILLGSGWRLPTYTEWNNADQNGGWNNRNDTYNSVLNLHAAGYLSLYNGSLFDRGTSGYYWSSTQSSATNSWGLYFGISYSGMPTHFKTIGFIGRCLRD
ncbi:MAG: hypothetical protein JXA03_04720, partial [Bacteroidales bacterium]|nr:hypothetical protein [Bacteroidales bacterium]